MLKLAQRIHVVDSRVTHAEAPEPSFGKRPLMDKPYVYVPGVQANTLEQAGHHLHAAFELLAKALAVKYQQAGDIELLVGDAGKACNVADDLVGKRAAERIGLDFLL